MDSETASSADEHQAFGSAAADTRGKHRILAELKRVQQESKFLEEEVEELDRTDNVSTLCEDMLLRTVNRPDPLLPLTNGPINPSWDRWFEGPQDLPGCRCWML
ncbi:Guanine nucleotide-binding protein subunit gamma 1 [Hibiscus syriacus]|uniref:Guanine nucleotide-binding protein subunit gamma 1 n=1 Tax=Hibiscus syriacus TaxID=106335 RepID=A0A6A2XVN6_HIBSY|nr:guanine nucleotide-binding protein subunit gamma 1-like isoform X1 [Hibiscus syriacus]KAE8679628.1 Guanine nucleotide-binding protein subunit gamma 1 [Hibiscus syriacus]